MRIELFADRRSKFLTKCRKETSKAVWNSPLQERMAHYSRRKLISTPEKGNVTDAFGDLAFAEWYSSFETLSPKTRLLAEEMIYGEVSDNDNAYFAFTFIPRQDTFALSPNKLGAGGELSMRDNIQCSSKDNPSNTGNIPNAIYRILNCERDLFPRPLQLISINPL